MAAFESTSVTAGSSTALLGPDIDQEMFKDVANDSSGKVQPRTATNDAEGSRAGERGLPARLRSKVRGSHAIFSRPTLSRDLFPANKCPIARPTQDARLL